MPAFDFTSSAQQKQSASNNTQASEIQSMLVFFAALAEAYKADVARGGQDIAGFIGRFSSRPSPRNPQFREKLRGLCTGELKAVLQEPKLDPVRYPYSKHSLPSLYGASPQRVYGMLRTYFDEHPEDVGMLARFDLQVQINKTSVSALSAFSFSFNKKDIPPELLACAPNPADAKTQGIIFKSGLFADWLRCFPSLEKEGRLIYVMTVLGGSGSIFGGRMSDKDKLNRCGTYPQGNTIRYNRLGREFKRAIGVDPVMAVNGSEIHTAIAAAFLKAIGIEAVIPARAPATETGDGKPSEIFSID